MNKIYIDFDNKSQMCTFNCGANWGDWRITPTCYGCMLAYGYNYTDEYINRTMPDLNLHWDMIKQQNIATKTRLEAAEAELHKTNAALKSSEHENALLKIELEKFKVKALEENNTLKLQAVQVFRNLEFKAGRAQIDTIEAKSHALDLEMKIEKLEIQNRNSEAELDILKAGLVKVMELYTIKGEVDKVVEADAEPKKQGRFLMSDIKLADTKPEI